ncbi:MAG: GtrA family protein [Chloroflexi bacterium]|nr:GtrA family protein [Chloroflexota bacterium]
MKELINSNQRFVKFALVGISGTVVDFGFFNLFSVLIGLPVILSSILSFSIAVVNNFYWNRVWTYPESKTANLADQLTKFGIVSVLGLVIRTPLFVLIEKPVIQAAQNLLSPTFSIDPVIIGHNLALATVIIVVLFWNYFVNRKWTYKDLDLAER